MLGMISTSIIFQILFAIVMIVISVFEYKIKGNQMKNRNGPTWIMGIDFPLSVTILDYISMVLVMFVSILNASISGFGLTDGKSCMPPGETHNNTT